MDSNEIVELLKLLKEIDTLILSQPAIAQILLQAVIELLQSKLPE